jgi:hypothetical protein
MTVLHRPDPDHPDAFGDAGDFAGVILDLPVQPYDDDFRLVGPVDQQLGWTDLDGVRLELVVQITAPGLEVESAVRLSIEGQAGPCDVFPIEGESCRYVHVPGEFVIDGFEEGDCEGATRPKVLFQPADRAAETCIADTGAGPLVERPVRWPGLDNADPDCLAQQGWAVGTALEGSVSLILNGGCSPMTVNIDVMADMCQMECF